MLEQPGSSREDRLDALRRRLYRDDATEADLQRFLDERGAVPQAEPEPEAPQPISRRFPRRCATAALVLAVAVVGGAALLVQQTRAATDAAAPTAGPATTQRLVQDIGEGRVLAVQDGTVSAPVAAATSVRGVAAVGQRFTGRGSAVVPFDPPTGVTHGGRAMVVVTSSSTSPVAWRALLRVPRDDQPSYPVVLARGRTTEPWGMAGPTTFAFSDRPPSSIAVEAPDDVAWTLLVAATDGVEPDLR